MNSFSFITKETKKRTPLTWGFLFHLFHIYKHMKVIITEEQFRKVIKEEFIDKSSKIKKMYLDGDVVMIQYVTDGELYDEEYETVFDDFRYDDWDRNQFIKSTAMFLKNNNLEYILDYLVDMDNNFRHHCYEPSGKPLPCRFINDVFGGTSREDNVKKLQEVIDFVWNAEYPIKVYRGLTREEFIDKDYIGEHWSTDKEVAEHFAGKEGKYIYVGLIEKREDVYIPSTVDHRMTFDQYSADEDTYEHEINGKVKIIGKYENPLYMTN